MGVEAPVSVVDCVVNPQLPGTVKYCTHFENLKSVPLNHLCKSTTFLHLVPFNNELSVNSFPVTTLAIVYSYHHNLFYLFILFVYFYLSVLMSSGEGW